jgi:hypothetical protein
LNIETFCQSQRYTYRLSHPSASCSSLPDYGSSDGQILQQRPRERIGLGREHHFLLFKLSETRRFGR